MRGELETEQNCNRLTPLSYGHNSISLPFSWAAQPGAWGPSLSGIWSSFQHLLSNLSELQLLNRGPEGPLCWVLVLSTASCLQLIDFLSSPGLYNCSTPTFFLWASQIALNSTHPRSRLYPDIPRLDAPVIYTGAFPILTAWLGSICYNCTSQIILWAMETSLIAWRILWMLIMLLKIIDCKIGWAFMKINTKYCCFV